MSTYNLRCRGCGHVGSRTFAMAADKQLRDVLGGDRGVKPSDCRCQCGGRSFDLKPVVALGDTREQEAPDA